VVTGRFMPVVVCVFMLGFARGSFHQRLYLTRCVSIYEHILIYSTGIKMEITYLERFFHAVLRIHSSKVGQNVPLNLFVLFDYICLKKLLPKVMKGM
jgi:hypothetical protein